MTEIEKERRKDRKKKRINYQLIGGQYTYCMNAFHFLEQGEQMERTEKEENQNDRN